MATEFAAEIIQTCVPDEAAADALALDIVGLVNHAANVVVVDVSTGST